MLRVTDLKQSLDFYCNKLGLIEYTRKESEHGRFTLIFLAAPDDLEAKTPLLELTYNWDEQKYTGGKNFGHLAFGVSNIYKTCQTLMDAGVIINRPPRDGYMAFIKSPDGISIELLQNGEKLQSAEPWASMENNGNW